MRLRNLGIVLATPAVLLAGCSTAPPYAVYDQPPTVAQRTEMGVVEAIDWYPTGQSAPTGLGAILGGVAGGVIGHQIGSGVGNTAATIAGAVGGAMVGGSAGSAIAQGSQFGLGTLLLRYSRDFEKQADLLGSQIMARAGYDPRDMAAMFRIIAQRSGSGGPEWLSDHPNPGNRYDYITREARLLRVTNPVRDTGRFRVVRARLRQLPPAPTTRQVTQR